MKSSYIRQLTRNFQPDRILPSFTAGLIAGVIIVMIEISLAALIFSGDLSAFVSDGIGLTLFSSFVIGVVVALTSSFRGIGRGWAGHPCCYPGPGSSGNCRKPVCDCFAP